ncbi:hypothetical protein PG994_013698 [Apiospora phragmitis]|uniref:Uncharacterized protein n=1 Tax=Apiospora phragmitis TaxID=2905665 RepID=A0ABR1T9C8_9PEZI
MPAIMDDPESPTIHRVSGALPYRDPSNPTLPPDVRPRQVAQTLLKYLSDQLAKEIEGGDTYPMIDPMPENTLVERNAVDYSKGREGAALAN